MGVVFSGVGLGLRNGPDFGWGRVSGCELETWVWVWLPSDPFLALALLPQESSEGRAPVGRAQAAAAGHPAAELLQAYGEDYIEALEWAVPALSEPGPARPQPGGRCHHPMRCWRPSHARRYYQVMAWGSYKTSSYYLPEGLRRVSCSPSSSVPMYQEHYRLASLALPLPRT